MNIKIGQAALSDGGAVVTPKSIFVGRFVLREKMQRIKIEDWLEKHIGLWCVYEYTFFVLENSSALSLFEREILQGGKDG